MTSDPLTPSPLSGPVDECAALRAEEQIRADVASDPARQLLAFRGPRTVIARLVADVPALLARLAVVERDLAEARAQLAESDSRWRTACELLGERTTSLAAAQARLEAVQALCDEVDEIARGPLPKDVNHGYASTAVEIARVRAALAVSPPEPEADDSEAVR